MPERNPKDEAEAQGTPKERKRAPRVVAPARDVAEWFLYLWGDCQRALMDPPTDFRHVPHDVEAGTKELRELRREIRKALAEAREAQVEGFELGGKRVALPKVEKVDRLLRRLPTGLGGGERPVLESTGSPYPRGETPWRGEHRPADDPDPMLFVFIEVEACLYSFAPANPEGAKARATVEWAFAHHVYAEGRSAHSFRHQDIEGLSLAHQTRGIRDRILERMATSFLSYQDVAANFERAARELKRRRHGRRD